MTNVNTKTKDVPKLRFREFTDEWRVKKLGSLLDSIESGVSPSTLKLNNKEGVPFLKVEDLNNSEKYQTHSRNYVEDTSGKMTIPRKSVIFPKRGAAIMTNKVRINTVDVLMDTNLMAITPNNTLLSNDFLYLKILDDGLYKIADTSTIPQINNKHIIPYKIAIPQLAEQEKIAGFLTTVDERVELVEKRVELLKKYKKGMMQKIFTQKIRFKDENGNSYPSWQEKKLGDLVDIFDGTHQTPNYVNNGIPFYSVEHVTANDFTNTKYISEDIFSKEKNRPKKGDILMTRIGDIGTTRYLDWDVNASFYVSLALLKNSKHIDNKYLNYYISTSRFQNELWKRTIHVAFPKKINLGEIGTCIVEFPSTHEQQKIADFLTSLDDKIKIEEEKLNQAKNFKKSLLQRMFV